MAKRRAPRRSEKRMESFWARALQREVLPVPGGPCSSTTLPGGGGRGGAVERGFGRWGASEPRSDVCFVAAAVPGPQPSTRAWAQVYSPAPRAAAHRFQQMSCGSTRRSAKCSADTA